VGCLQKGACALGDRAMQAVARRQSAAVWVRFNVRLSEAAASAHRSRNDQALARIPC
jgi:hypothetical protein